MNHSETRFVKRYEPGKEAQVELVNGRIVDVANGRYLDAGTSITLQGGKIESMPGLAGESSDVTPDFTIDLQGKTVLPSLFNTHMHGPGSSPTLVPGLRDMLRARRHKEQQIAKDMAECLAHGITHIRDAQSPDLRDNRSVRERISKGEMPGPRIVQAVLVGQKDSYLQEKVSLAIKVMGRPSVDPAEDYAGAVAFAIDATERQVRDAVDIAVDERGADAIKIGDEPFSPISGKPVPVMTIEQLSAVADQARRRGVPSTMHHSSIESFRRGVKAGVSSLAHQPQDAQLTQGDLEAFKASGCISDPTVSAFYALFSWKLAGDQSTDHPELNRLTEFRDKTYTFAAIADEYYIPELRASVMSGYKRCASGRPRMMGIIDMSLMFAWSARAAIVFENSVLLYENGVPMTTGNDAGASAPCTPAMVDLELLMIDHVLKGKSDRKPFSCADAVKIATINSARSLGLEQEFGTIETGKTADLVILDGDPLKDFRLIGSRVAALFMDGNLVINNCGLEVKPNGKARSYHEA
jgi:imidazolonepropionase-like amidohydrolase